MPEPPQPAATADVVVLKTDGDPYTVETFHNRQQTWLRQAHAMGDPLSKNFSMDHVVQGNFPQHRTGR